MNWIKCNLYALMLSLILPLTACTSLPVPSAQPTQKPHAQAQLPQQIKPYKKQNNIPVVALVLGSGGARGYAHIGAIDVLEQYGIRPDFIVGVSAGSIVGALYASGQHPAKLKETAMNFKAGQVRDITLDKKGFFDGQKIEDFVNEQVQAKPLEQMAIPLYVVATELQHGELTVFNQGNTGQAVRASASIPSMIVPTKIGDTEYVDGGLVSPVPVELAKRLGADVVIAINILAQPKYTSTEHVWGLFNQNINIMQNRLAARELALADIVIQPDLREKGHIFSTKTREDTMRAGAMAVEKALPQLQRVFEKFGIAQDLERTKTARRNAVASSAK